MTLVNPSNSIFTTDPPIYEQLNESAITPDRDRIALKITKKRTHGLNSKKGLMRMSGFRYNNEVEDWKWVLTECWEDGLQSPEVPSWPVVIQYFRGAYPGKPMDQDNLTASFKIIGDAMHKASIIPDDDPAYIANIIGMQYELDRQENFPESFIVLNTVEKFEAILASNVTGATS